MKLVIEYGERGGYGTFHRAGCRDVEDGAEIGEADDYATACELADTETYWAAGDGDSPTDYGYRVAPCTGIKKGGSDGK